MIELKDLEKALNESYNNYVNAQAEIKVLQRLIEAEKAKAAETESSEPENV